MDLSIVTTLYRSAPHLREFCSRMSGAARTVASSYEIIMVNDGSPDLSLDVARSLRAEEPNLRIIDLSRNFGHHKAILTGLAYARGDRVFLIDCDLEEDPELLTEFSERLRRADVDVVYGVQKKRKGGWFERISGRAFYTLFNALSSSPIPRNLLTLRLMTRRYVDALLALPDREVYLPGLMAAAGFLQEPVFVEKHSLGTSTYTLQRKLRMMGDAVPSFSSRPLVYIFYLGIVILGLSGAVGLYILGRAALVGGQWPGWPLLIVSVWLLGGIAIFCQGIIGVYLARVLMEVKQRPRTIVRAVYAGDQPVSEAMPVGSRSAAPSISGAGVVSVDGEAAGVSVDHAIRGG